MEHKMINPIYLVLLLFTLLTSALFLVSLNPHLSQSRLQRAISQCEALIDSQTSR